MAEIVGTITNLSDFLSKTQVCLSVKPNDPQQQIICLEADRKYSIPAFQREVRWDDNNLKMLLYDLSRSSKFLGNIILTIKSDHTCEIIDGQQRTTVLMLIVSCIKKKFGTKISTPDLCPLRNEGFTGFQTLLEKAFDQEAITSDDWNAILKSDDYLQLAAFEAEKVEKEKQRQELDKSYEKLNQEKNDILKEQQKNRGEIDVKITSILGIIKSPYLLSESLCARMFELGNSMKKLKLPKTIAKDFFTELASADRCVCDRCIGERERTAILKRADQYLGSDQQSVLNTVKSSLMDSVYDERLKKAFEELEELRAQANRLDTRFKTNEEKLIKAGGEKARELQERIEELIRLISIARDELERIESKDENDASLTEENNLHKADQKFKYYEQEIAKATRTNTALRKKELVDSLVNEIKLQATTALKQEIVRKTNEKLHRVIVDDYVEIESIDRYIKLKGRDGASEGQTLSIAYCFLGTLFEDSELEFPFIIDSPTGKMDFEKRQAVADIIPLVFNQMIAFVQSAEVERFADRFYANPDSQYLTVVASPQDQAVVVYEGIDFFDSYQREHKGDEK